MAEWLQSIIGLVIAATYLGLGWYLADLSWEVWHRGKVTRLSHTLFPWMSRRNRLGDFSARLPLVWFKERNRELPMLRLDDDETDRARNEYCLCLAMAWPLKVVYNLAVLALLLIIAGSRRLYALSNSSGRG